MRSVGDADSYDYDLPGHDDCWHLDGSREVNIRIKGFGEYQPIATYKRVGINARAAWDYATKERLKAKGDKIKVVILDNGVDLLHPSLERNTKDVREDSRDFDHNFEPEGRPPAAGGRIDNRFNAHGTACAGIVGAIELPGSRVVGVAPECLLVAIRISTNLEVGRLIEAVRYAGKVGHVILLPRFLPDDQQLADAVREVAGQVPVICAAGNTGADRLIHPASLIETIAVGACNDRGYRSTYSQYGESLDLVAPSNDVAVEDRELIRLDADEVDLRERERRELEARLTGKPLPTVVPQGLQLLARPQDREVESDRTRGVRADTLGGERLPPGPNLDRMGILSIATTDNSGDFGYNYEPQGDYCKATGDFGFGGTSAAAAQVAGVVALMLSARLQKEFGAGWPQDGRDLPNEAKEFFGAALPPGKVRQILHAASSYEHLHLDPSPDDEDEKARRRRQEFGHGLIDAAKAVTFALDDEALRAALAGHA